MASRDVVNWITSYDRKITEKQSQLDWLRQQQQALTGCYRPDCILSRAILQLNIRQRRSEMDRLAFWKEWLK